MRSRLVNWLVGWLVGWLVAFHAEEVRGANRRYVIIAMAGEPVSQVLRCMLGGPLPPCCCGWRDERLP